MSGPASLPILGIHGAPRSGTTWLGQIFNSSPAVAYRYQPFFAHAFRPRVDASRTAQELEEILGDIAVTEDDFILQRGPGLIARRELSFPKGAIRQVVYKEVRYHHLLPRLMQLRRFRGVGIVRNPLDVLASWVRAPREFQPDWSLEAEWRAAPAKNRGRIEEFYGFEGWKRAVTLFQELEAAEPDRFRIVVYDDLVRDPIGAVAALFDFAGLPLDEQVRAFVARSTSSADDDPYGVMRDGQVRSHRAALPEAIRQAIAADLAGTPLARFL